MANSLYPASVVVDYHSPYGFHKMTLPIKAINNPEDATGNYTVTNWDGDTILLQDMIEALVTELLPRFASTVEFDSFTPFHYPTIDDPPIPLLTIALAMVGTAGTPGWYKATMETQIMRDTEAQICKLVLLDFASGNNFEKYTNPATAGVEDIFLVLTSIEWGFSSRNGKRPASFVARTATLNQKLREEYRMA